MIPDPETGEDRVTPAMRAYLVAIAQLDDGRGPVTTHRIAERIGFSCPSVTNMIKRLHGWGLIEYEPYHGVRLTTPGVKIAVRGIRRRELLVRYLVETLGYPTALADTEARRLEVAVTDALETHISAALRRGDALGRDILAVT